MRDNPFDPERHTCPVCDGASLWLYKVDYRKVRIGRCDSCGAQFMNPPYSDEHLAHYYEEYNEAEQIGLWQEALTYCHDFYLSLIERFGRVGHLLDIGCGNGHLIRAALARGWTAEGFDVSDASTKRVTKELGITVHVGDFLNVDWPEKSFDLVTMHHVLEHVKEPAAYICRIHLLLRDDGLVFIASPNIRGLSHRLKDTLERLGIRRKNVGKYYDTHHHVIYFDPKTLKELLTRNGFEVVYQRNCHKARPNQSSLKRAYMRRIGDHLIPRGTFLMIARKRG